MVELEAPNLPSNHNLIETIYYGFNVTLTILVIMVVLTLILNICLIIYYYYLA